MVVLFLGAVCATPHAMAQEQPLVPEAFQLDEAANGAVNAAWLTDDERQQLRVFHGVWDERDLTTHPLRAAVALNAWRFEDNSLWEPQTPVEFRAEARLLAGEFESAIEMLGDAPSNHAARLRAQALEGLGRYEEADRAIDELIQRLQSTRLTDPAEITEGVRAMLIRTRLQEQPARDFQTMLSLLAKAHQELDRLYWPAKLAEAELLLEKDNLQEAVAALRETLSLNPRCAQAWHALGQVAISRFDFASANIAAEALRRLNRDHPLADLLLAQSRLTQDDPEGAEEIVKPLLERHPQLRPALALHAAAKAISYDQAATKAALDQYDALSPGSAQAYYIVGKQLSFNRQYEVAAEMLEEAIRRQPAWPAPQIDLGLMEMQSGRDDRALAALQSVVKLDPFNQRAAFSLHLLEELTKYAVLESEHFIVRYARGPDEVMAVMMLPELERIHATVAGRFNHEPGRKTVIELHPNHPRFAVRITGMPFVHTIAACTGPVIALEVPREGRASEHRGLFDWPRVIQHEYTHTITLDQTRNRIPHWLTEAAAVSMEPGPRTYETCQMLASAYHNDTVFRLDELKWAFIRPKLPGDRGKAYAIGHWIVEYMNERFGESALVRLLERYHAGEREQQAIPAALGLSREQFFTDFMEWAGHQVQAWGLGAGDQPTVIELMDELRWADPDKAIIMAASQQARLDVIVEALTNEIGRPAEARTRPLTADRWPPVVRPPVEITDAILANWIEKYPNHPDLAELKLRRYLTSIGGAPAPAQEAPHVAEAHVGGADDQTLIDLLETYSKLRPVDPLPHKRLALLWLESDTPEKAIPHLEELDIREEKTPVHAVTLAKLYRQRGAAGDLDTAMAKATRALHINPYSAPNRELAAAIAIEAKRYDIAKQHILALTILEPDRPQHAKRLEAIEKLAGQ